MDDNVAPGTASGKYRVYVGVGSSRIVCFYLTRSNRDAFYLAFDIASTFASLNLPTFCIARR